MINPKKDFEKLKELFSGPRLSAPNRKKALTAVAELLLLIAICALSVHFLLRSETLSDYAKNDPEAAYGTDGAGDTGSAVKTRSVNQSTAVPTEGSAAGSEPRSSVESSVMTSVSDSSAVSVTADIFTYKDGFTSSPLTDKVKAEITGVSYPDAGSPAFSDSGSKVIPYEDLRLLNVRYMDFGNSEQNGELICNKAISRDLLEIFYELYKNDYQIDRIRLIDEYSGDDESSMADDNTSCFNYRVIAGKTKLSLHASGLAVDLNPLYNPSITYNRDGSENVAPAGSVKYADRSSDFPYKITSDDLAYKLFTAHGFTWGGNWNSCKDYQHFEKKPD
jgi:hypothetical protein